MDVSKRIVVVAGEESGDYHGATFVKELLQHDSTIQFSGIGGKHLQNAGTTLISDLAKHGVTGATEIIRHALVIHRAYRDIQQHLINTKPDLLVLIDYPGFNLRLAKFAKKKLGLRILYYISPQIWAWKAKRIEIIRNYIDHMAVIFPFEKELYRQENIPVSFVGHPILKKIETIQQNLPSREELQLPTNKRIIALLPGSRVNEIKRHMPILIQTVERLSKQNNNLHYVIPVAQTISLDKIHRYFKNKVLPITLIHGNALEVMATSDCVVVASGTASLECALLKKPMCIIYKSSLLTYLAASHFIKVNYLGLCNLLHNKMLVPEFLQYDCNVTELTRTLTSLLHDSEISKKMIARLEQVTQDLSNDNADCTITRLIEQLLSI